MKRIVVANGPNLNLLGGREPAIYGFTTLAEIERMVRARATELQAEVAWFQTNSEGELLDRLQAEAPASAGVILNGGALTHYSYALYDCLRALGRPIVEVHISNLYARTEAFRAHSVTAPAATGVISGLGPIGYVLALEYLIDRDE
ncbi:MAG: 3-dehydroquinate dehydratase [Candidatus Dormibacteraeota bacterium]|nr:3-dehydroquinate dehydratase [Candidatus Dormibacteraeota bacterium]